MNDLLASLVAQVSAERLRDLTLDLVRVPSPTGDGAAVTAFYKKRVESILDLPVEVVTTRPDGPWTLTRWPGSGNAPSLTLDGHLDTIHAFHAKPEARDGRVYGRGSGDMKSGVAALMEAVRILKTSGVQLPGELRLFTHTLHEAPVGHMECLKEAIARGDVFTDAAIVAESGFDTVNFCGKGQAIFDIHVTRQGEVLHENVGRPKGVRNPLDHAVALASAFVAQDAEMADGDAYPILGPETHFLGQIHGGDFYNRIPNEAYVQGIHRFWPDKEWSDIGERFDALLASVPAPDGIEVDISWAGNGLGWEMGTDAPIVRSLQRGYETITGNPLPLTGGLSVCDVNVIAREGGIPAVAHGTGTTTAHADVEWVEIANIVRACKIYLATILDYYGMA